MLKLAVAEHEKEIVGLDHSGMSLDDVAELLGDKTTRMLEAHFRHRVRSLFDRHVEHVEAIFGTS
jgi:hypothetical protein